MESVESVFRNMRRGHANAHENRKKNSEHGGKTCGKDFEEEECNKKPCPVNCKLNEWSTWSECKVDDAVAARCGGGTRTRTRTIKEKAQHGGTCDVELEEKQECGAGTWVPMSTCDAKCGGGKITETFLPITLGPNCNHKEGATREKRLQQASVSFDGL